MTDQQLRRFVRSFRKALIGDHSSEDCCAVVCWPLAALLVAHGITVDAVESKTSWNGNHVWLRLPDGRALDPTADQFSEHLERRMPKVYLGRPIPEIHQYPGIKTKR